MTRGQTGLERGRRPLAGLVPVVVVGLGLLARLRAARGPFLTPDEMLHVRAAAADSLLDVYRSTLDNAHPPLFALLLHFWSRVARSDWALRLLPVALGTLFLWAVYRWARSLFGETAALLTLELAAFLPSVVIVSAELRGYALMLCLVAAMLAALERAFERDSVAWIALSAAFGALALFSHYAAFRFVAAAFLYAVLRLRARPQSIQLERAWAMSQVVLSAVALLLYRSHVSKLRGGALEQEARETWLRESYFSGDGSFGPAAFLARQTMSLFRYLFSSSAAGFAALLLVVFAMCLLLYRREPSVILLGLPLVLGAAGGLFTLYPYGGTRHSIDLVICAAAGVGVALARLAGDRRWVAIAAGAALAPAAFVLGS